MTDEMKPDTLKDETAMNHEIAALLLNLASRTTNPPPPPQQQDPPVTYKAEDLSMKKPVLETAIDLSKSKPLELPTVPPSLNTIKLPTVKTPDLKSFKPPTVVTVPSVTTSLPTSLSTSYPFFNPSLAMAGLNPSLAMNSTYLLQNLLLGKMHQLSTAPTSTSSSNITVPPSSFPTQPIPATALTSTNTSSLKPPASVLKSALPSAPTVSTITPLTLDSTASTNIPLLCGQIVAQLNGLLFLVHSLNNKSVEMNLQTQLSAIHQRLQEVVSMVEQAKKQQEDGMPKKDVLLKQNEIQKQLEKMKESKIKEEEKIAKHIQDYQLALLQQQKEQEDFPGDVIKNGDEEMQEAESTSGSMSAAARRRRGRPPKNSNSDLSYSPTDPKRPRDSPPTLENGQAVTNGIGSSAPPSVPNTPVASKSGKGIRNRVFCGECAGCLKNDDCGRCRYCKDKTKFGGQNRLRQKCLHRRCQMDTHRKRNSNNNNNNSNNGNNNNNTTPNTPSSNNQPPAPAPPAAPPTVPAVPVVSAPRPAAPNAFGESETRQSPSPTSIYSGVELAKLHASQQLDGKDSQQLSPGEILRSPPTTNIFPTLVVPQLPPRPPLDPSSEDPPTDEDDDHRLGKCQSRIDKWKAKHEAMLKLAAAAKKDEQNGAEEEKGSPVVELPNIEASDAIIEFKTAATSTQLKHNGTALQTALSV